MVCHRYTMVYHGIPWYTMVYSWYTVGIPRYTMVYHVYHGRYHGIPYPEPGGRRPTFGGSGERSPPAFGGSGGQSPPEKPHLGDDYAPGCRRLRIRPIMKWQDLGPKPLQAFRRPSKSKSWCKSRTLRDALTIQDASSQALDQITDFASPCTSGALS